MDKEARKTALLWLAVILVVGAVALGSPCTVAPRGTSLCPQRGWRSG